MADTDYSLDLQADGYLRGVSQASQATQVLSNAVSSLTQQSVLMRRALEFAIPAGALGAFSKFSTGAADATTAMATMRATATVTGQSVHELHKGYEQLARSMPISNAAARALTTQIQGLGVTTKGSEAQVNALAVTMTKMAAATGSSLTGITDGLAQTSRAFGNLNLANKPVKDLGDSLVVLQAKFGGSAEGITSFTRQIAPFARDAGLSAQATLGIAGAFSKLGDESGAASTAVSKVLADVNRAVRDGGPQLMQYAAIVGQTSKQFEALYKQNPGEALSRVTEAIGRGGPRGARQLEALGFDSVRVQRALSSLSQSGGLREAINASVEGYGSGAADRASKTAMEGFNESLTKLTNVSEQFAERLGGPVLGALTGFTEGITAVLKPLNDIAGSKVVQSVSGAVSNVAFGVGAPIGLAAGAMGVLGRFAVGNAIRTAGWRSSIAQNARAGAMEARYGSLDAAEEAIQSQLGGVRAGSFRGRRYARQLEDINAARRLEGMTEEELAGRPLARTAVQARGFAAGALTPGESSPGIGFRQRFINWASLGVTGFTGMTGSHQDLAMRGSRPYGSDANDIKRPESYASMLSNRLKMVFQSAEGPDGEKLGFFDKLKATTKHTDGIKKAFGDIDKEMADAPAVASSFKQALRTTGRTAGSLARNLAGSIGAGIGAMGPIGIGIAGIGIASSLWSRHKEAQERERAEYEGIKDHSITSGLDSLNTSIGHAASGAGIFADAAKQAAKDILGSVQGDVTKVSQADLDAARSGKTGKSRLIGDAGAVASQINVMSREGLDDAQMQGMKRQLLAAGRSPDEVEDIMSRVSRGPQGDLTADQIRTAGSAAGALARVDKKLGGQQISTLTGRVQQDYLANKDKYGEGYARQVQLRESEQLIEATGGNKQAMKELASGLGLKDPSDLGSLRENLAKLRDYTKLSGYGQPGVVQPGAVFNTLTGTTTDASGRTNYVGGASNFVSQSGVIGQAFDLRSNSAAGQAMRAVKPGDSQSIEDAINALLTGAKAGGQSLTDFANEAQGAAANMADGVEAAVLRMAAVRARETRDFSRGINPSGALVDSLTDAFADAQVKGDDDTSKATREAGRAGIKQGIGSLEELYAQRLMALKAYTKQTTRAVEDNNLQVSRAEEQYRISSERGYEDFYRSRARSLRDFARQQRRAAEDAAKAFYDPFHRANVEALWDNNSLLVNLADQNKRMADQVRNLNRLREMGLSNQVIQQLDLANASHAQQVQLMVDNASGDPRQLAQLNQAVAQRAKVGAALYGDAGNVSLARSREDFQTSLKDQEVDFSKSMARSAEDYKRSMDHMAADFKKGLARAEQDYQDSQKTINGNLLQLQEAWQGAVNGQFDTFDSLLTNQLDMIEKRLKDKSLSMADVWARGIGIITSGTSASGGTTGDNQQGGAGGSRGRVAGADNMTTANEFISGMSGPPKKMSDPVALGKKLAAAAGWTGEEWAALYWLWQQESGWNPHAKNRSGAYGIPQASPGSKMASFGKDWKDNPETQIRWGIDYIKRRYHDPLGAVQHKLDTDTRRGAPAGVNNNQPGGWYAQGSIFSSARVIGVGEGGPEAVIPLNDRGTKVLAEAFRRAMSGGREQAAARTHVVYDHSRHTYDMGMRVEGPVTVKANNPREFAELMLAERRKANFTAPATKKR